LTRRAQPQASPSETKANRDCHDRVTAPVASSHCDWLDLGVSGTRRCTAIGWVRPPAPWVSFRTIPKNSRDLVVRGTHVEPSTNAAASVVLPCRWPRIRRTVAPRPGHPNRLATHPRPPAALTRALTGPGSNSDLSWSLAPYNALDLEQRLPTPTTSAGPTRRAIQTRLRYAFRLSQPLDVFFHSKPFQPCFMLVALMGFGLRRLPLDDSCSNVTRSAS